jgi:hypothetical protein
MPSRLRSALLLSVATLLLTACAANPAAAPTAAKNIYLDYNVYTAGTPSTYQPEIFDYPVTGTASPTVLSTNASSIAVTAIATDKSGYLYVALFDNSAYTAQIVVFAPGATGSSATPIRRFHFGEMTAPVYSLTVDTFGNVYVFDYNDNLFKFSPYALDIASPLLTLTNFFEVGGVATDSSGNLYVAIQQMYSSITIVSNGRPPKPSIYVYPAGFTSATPGLVITPPVNEYMDGLALDSAGNLYVSGELVSGTGAGRIDVYAPGASGNATPLRTITGSATKLAGSSTSNGNAYNNLAIDPLGTLYVRSVDGSASNLSVINQFSSTASGNVAPTTSVTTTLDSTNNLDIAVY